VRTVKAKANTNTNTKGRRLQKKKNQRKNCSLGTVEKWVRIVTCLGQGADPCHITGDPHLYRAPHWLMRRRRRRIASRDFDLVV
jgi:hypothetical protein